MKPVRDILFWATIVLACVSIGVPIVGVGSARAALVVVVLVMCATGLAWCLLELRETRRLKREAEALFEDIERYVEEHGS